MQNRRPHQQELWIRPKLPTVQREGVNHRDIAGSSRCEINIDVAIIIEPYRSQSSGTLVGDKTGQATLWACREKAFQEIMEYLEVGFIRAKVKVVHINGCYDSLDEYKQMLNAEDATRRWSIIIAGDFNARLLNCAAGQQMLGDVFWSYNFREKGLGSIVDLAFVSAAFVRKVAWQVSEEGTHSDLQATCSEVKSESSLKKKSQSAAWVVKVGGESFRGEHVLYVA